MKTIKKIGWRMILFGGLAAVISASFLAAPFPVKKCFFAVIASIGTVVFVIGLRLAVFTHPTEK